MSEFLGGFAVIKIEFSDEVYETLKRKRPSLARQIPGILEKYRANLEEELNKAIARGRSVEGWLFNAYDIPLAKVGDRGGTVWTSGNVRVHKWLVDNGVNLFKKLDQIRVANNFTKKISLVSFTDLVKVIDQESLDALRLKSESDLTDFLNNPSSDDVAKFQPMLKEVNALPVAARKNKYHDAPIDVQSLQSYIRKLMVNEVPDLTVLQADTNNRCAIKLLRIAQLNNGVLPQKVNPSDFGRIYYEGYSVQSVKKSLRAAMLGDSYEYDIKSSVISWKMSFAKNLMQAKGLSGDPEHEFPGISYYLKDKRAFTQDVINQVFLPDCPWSIKKKEDKIKEAMTALSFGAKLIEASWEDSNGVEQETSIMKILDDVGERERFISSSYVAAFKQDQDRLDAFITDVFKKKLPNIKSIERLQTKRGTSKSKLLSWLYQHAETEIMDFVRAEIAMLSKNVIANVHDAIVVRQKLTGAELQNIVQKTQSKFRLDYFDLGEKPYQRCC